MGSRHSANEGIQDGQELWLQGPHGEGAWTCGQADAGKDATPGREGKIHFKLHYLVRPAPGSQLLTHARLISLGTCSSSGSRNL